MRNVNLESTLHNIFGTSFFEGPARCRAVAYELHRDGCYDAREYQELLQNIALYFDGESRDIVKAPLAERVRMSRQALAVMGAKMGQLQNAVASKELSVREEIGNENIDLHWMTVETGPIHITVSPKCDRDGNVELSDFQVNAVFDVTVTHSKQCNVRV